jgi:hypothetical protein
MDDPWGSPWATTDGTSKNDSTSRPPNDLLSPPPKAFFGSWSNPANQSPWADDDSKGVWDGTDQVEATTPSAGWGIWGDAGSQGHSSTPRADLSRKPSPIPSPGLKPAVHPQTSSIFRHPSPDPWASEPTWNDSTGHVSSYTSQIEELETKDENTTRLGSALPHELTEKVHHLDYVPVEFPDEGLGTQKKDGVSPSGEAADAEPLPELPEHPGVSADIKEETLPQESHSRPSSSFSDASSATRDLPDSPITSIDEDPSLRLGNSPQQRPGRVLKLEGSGDGLLQTVPRESKTRRQPISDDELDSDEAADFGDFIEPDAGDIPLQGSDIPLSSDHEATARTSHTNEAKSGVGETQQDGQDALAASSLAIRQIVEKFGPIEFKLDLQDVDELFPTLPDTISQEGHYDSEFPDEPITDSFTSIEERKTWYRISRYGSLRKHNSGEDENYRGVNWKTSQIHTDVTKIVRRWMEEDSFCGKPTLGGIKRESVFNWDSSAAPIDLHEVFARRKKSVSHIRTTSLPPPRHVAMPSVSSALEDRQTPKDTHASPPGSATISSRKTGSPLATFGWSSIDAEASPTRSPNTAIGQGLGLSKPPSQSARQSSVSASSGSNSENINALHIILPGNVADNDDDDNEEWGEMVSSPPPEATKAILSNPPVDHKNIIRTIQTHSRSISQPPPSFKWPLSPNTPINMDSLVMTPNKSRPSGDRPSNIQKHKKSPLANIVVSNTDPWASADFSVFDKSLATPVLSPNSVASPAASEHPSARLQGTTSLPSPAPSEEHAAPPSAVEAKAVPWIPRSENITLSTVLSPVSTENPVVHDYFRGAHKESTKLQSPAANHTHPMPAAPDTRVILGPTQSSEEERKQDELVRRIVQNLPDLSYMLH